VKYLAPVSGGSYVDATIGGGGHAEAILEASAPTGRLLGVDRDPAAIRAARRRLAPFSDRLVLTCDRYGRLPEILEELSYGRAHLDGRRVDGVVVDAGVSSYQLDQADRGFAFSRTGPLDMRMSSEGETCADLIDRLDAHELARILRKYGEVTGARRIAEGMKEEREAGRLESTTDLAQLLERTAQSRPGRRIHPATQVFQALRIAVNRELDDLADLCESLPEILEDDGVGVVISFHSLEDRIVKRTLKRLSTPPAIPPGVPLPESQRRAAVMELLTRRAVKADEAETDCNPRARSARLRAARRRPRERGGS
jgi:16S rRNA (cytosine1402-N4)-methyltransferase